MKYKQDLNDKELYILSIQNLLKNEQNRSQINSTKSNRINIIRQYLSEIDNPQERNTIHVAGSKGKGSTAIMVDTLIRESLIIDDPNVKTMLTISPDLHSARERIQINGSPLSERQFVDIAKIVLDSKISSTASYFELITIMAWIVASHEKSAWQTLEVGLGGRLDPTNAIQNKEVAIITPIDLEHTAILGKTISEIAKEKSGIITSDCEVVTSPQYDDALEQIYHASKKVSANVHETTNECNYVINDLNKKSIQFDLETPDNTYKNISLPTLGRHQVENAITAIRASELALGQTTKILDPVAVLRAFSKINLPGRGEIININPTIILDGAHTQLAAQRLRESIDEQIFHQPHVYILAILQDKNWLDILPRLLPKQSSVVLPNLRTKRSITNIEIFNVLDKMGHQVRTTDDMESAIDYAYMLTKSSGTIIVTGSMYAVAEARELILDIDSDHELGLM
ncbi:MAG: hypothetical protein CL792_04640 [Chloroflexi bacterium]|nr:hypothetical protein [Chloroflexota bacterium]